MLIILDVPHIKEEIQIKINKYWQDKITFINLLYLFHNQAIVKTDIMINVIQESVKKKTIVFNIFWKLIYNCIYNVLS